MNRSVDLGEADPRSYVRLAARIRKQIRAGIWCLVVPCRRSARTSALPATRSTGPT